MFFVGRPRAWQMGEEPINWLSPVRGWGGARRSLPADLTGMFVSWLLPAPYFVPPAGEPPSVLSSFAVFPNHSLLEGALDARARVFPRLPNWFQCATRARPFQSFYSPTRPFIKTLALLPPRGKARLSGCVGGGSGCCKGWRGVSGRCTIATRKKKPGCSWSNQPMPRCPGMAASPQALQNRGAPLILPKAHLRITPVSSSCASFGSLRPALWKGSLCGRGVGRARGGQACMSSMVCLEWALHF